MRINRKLLIPILFLFYLIPFVGIVAGLVMLLFSALKSNEKTFDILVNVAGLVVSFLETFLFIQYLFNNTSTNKGFAKISGMQLNGLIPHIEFYKLQHHVYPDSLQQLNNDTLAYSAIIEDPVLVWAFKNKHGDPTTYFYKKMGNKYTIFSAGEDLKPNTSDDIYPTIKLDSSFSGFTK